MILAAVFLAGVLVGALLLGVVLAWLERDVRRGEVIDLTGMRPKRRADLTITTTRSPDWTGDAAKHRQDAGWE